MPSSSSRTLSSDPYVWCASLLLLFTLLLVSGFGSRYWLELRLQQQIETLSSQSHAVINTTNQALVNSSSHLHLLAQTLSELSSTQRVVSHRAAKNVLQSDLDTFHHQFELLGIWLLDKQGKVWLKSRDAIDPINLNKWLAQSAELAKARSWTRLILDTERQHTRHYYALPLADSRGLTLVMGTKLVTSRNDFEQIRLLITNQENTILYADESQWLGHQFLGVTLPSATPKSDSSGLALTTSALQPQILLLGEEQTPSLWLNQPSLQQGLTLHALADSSQILHQAEIKNKLAAIIAVTTTGATWGAY
ncbi:hypothetical protein CBP12_13335 [Oceanisphaera avium]|uniref:Cache domain-containing protein n=2 Tax=Oceanisphaera avium TaxID=1903694 RepID=A0A1Y0D1E4_9GAMM|nr:hypothetical protein CBP12_13335 [Oceanisphaera avium]